MYLTVQVKALNRAAEMLGGPDRLREYLRVPARQLALWLSGAEKPPVDVFLKVVDLISDGVPVAKARDTTSHVVQRARELREKSGLLRTAITRTRERSEVIRASILARQDLTRSSPLRKARSSLGFFDTRFKP